RDGRRAAHGAAARLGRARGARSRATLRRRGRGGPAAGALTGRARGAGIACALARAHPGAGRALHPRDPSEMLVAAILSARCTDAMVNQVTPALFAAFPTPEALASAPAARVEELIRRTGFFRQKTKALQATARGLVEEHGGRVPDTMEELNALPGIGR